MGDAAHSTPCARLIRLALLVGLSACGESTGSTEPPVAIGTPTAIGLLTPFTAATPMQRKASDSLPSSLAVQLRDATGQPVRRAGRVLTLRVLEATGAVSTRIVIRRGDTTPTDSAGVARVTNLVLGGRAGDAVVQARIDSLPAVIFPVRLSVGALARTSSAVSISLDSVPVGGVSQITVMPLDADGNKRGTGEQITAALDGDQTTASVGVFTFVPGDSSYRGTITVTAPFAPRALRVNVNGAALAMAPMVTGVTATVLTTPASALRVVTIPGDTVGGYRTLSGAVWSSTVVQLVDASGAVVRQAGVAVSGSAVTTGGQPLPNATLTGASTTTNAQGQAVFPGIVLTAPAGTARLRFESGALTATGIPVQIAAGVVSTTRSTLTVSRDSLYVDSVSVITVVPRDAAGTALGSGASVALSMTGGTSAGTISAAAYSAIDSSYRAAFTATTRGTGSTLRATVNGSELSTTRVITVITQPGLVVASSPVTVVPDSIPVGGVSQFTATPLDGNGRKLGGGLSVSIALSSGSGVSVATAGSVTYSATDSSYRAGITGVTVGTTSMVTTTVNGVVLTTTRPLTVSSSAPANTATALAITAVSDTSGGGVLVQSGAIMNSVTVALRNSNGGAVAQAGVAITASAVTSDGTTAWPGAAITGGGGPLSTDANGQIVFPALQVSAPVGSGRIRFSGPNLTSVSFPVRVRAGVFSSSSTLFTLAPDTVAANGTSTAIVTPRDAIGNTLGSGQTVTLTLGAGTSGITIGATTFVASDSTYRATLTGTTAGTARTVTANVGGVAVTQTRSLIVVAAAGYDVSATVNGGSTFAISRYIYGGNFIEGAWEGATPPTEMTFNRFGGNRLTAYNWENNYSNAGNDFNYQNDSYLSGSTAPGEAVRGRASASFGRNQAFMATIPMLGYVAGNANAQTLPTTDANRVARLAAHFKVSQASKGSAFSLTPNASDGVVYQDEFVNWFNSNFPGRATHATAPAFFSLDNEPDIWHITHKEIQSDLNDNPSTPRLQTYRGFSDTSVVYSKAIKSAMPNAMVFGPATAVWSGVENLGRYPTADPDYGSQNFFDVYLDRMAAASAADGRRLLDVLDLHFYDEQLINGERLFNDFAPQTAATIQARLQAPRSLWDPTFNENSWVSQFLGGPIRLIPRLREKIAAHYPGTKIAITEYQYGRGGDITGGLAQADVLGIFGREGVYAASLWPIGNASAPNQAFGAFAYEFGAFRIFRNYDGAGSSFGDTGLAATTSDVAQSSIYASRTSAGRTVLVVLNKASTAKVMRITVSGVSAPTGAQVYVMQTGSPNPTRGADVTAGGGVITYTMPGYSVSVLALTP